MPRVPIPFSSYGSTRLTADVQRRINVYPNSQRGERQFPGAVQFAQVFYTTITEISSHDITADMVGANPLVTGMAFNADGSKYFCVENSAGDRFHEFALSTPYDVTSETHTATFVPADGVMHGMEWNAAGTQFNVIDNIGDRIEIYDLSGAYDISTVSAGSAFSLSALNPTNGGLTALALNSDGTKMLVGYIEDSAGFPKKIAEYALSAAYDVTSATLTRTVAPSNIGGAAISGLALEDDDLTLWITKTFETNDTTIDRYSMTSAGDVSTLFFEAGFSPIGVLTGLKGSIYYNGSLYTSDNSLNQPKIKQFNVNSEARGAQKMGTIPYAVLGTQLYSFDSSGVPTAIGEILGSGAVGMSTDGDNLVIAAGTVKYNYTVAGGLTITTDADLGDAFTSAYLDLRTYYDQTNGFAASAQNDPTSIEAIDIGTAESFNDSVLAVSEVNQLLYVWGKLTTEIWFSSGVGRPPVERTSVKERGIIGRRAVNSIDDVIYFLDHDRKPGRMIGIEYAPLISRETQSGRALGEEFDSYTTVDDCIVNTYAFQQENFAEFTFPTEDVTWVYHVPSKKWSKREDRNGNRSRIAFYFEAYNKLLGLDHSNGKVFEFSKSVYKDDGNAITRTIDSALITSELYEAEAKDLLPTKLSATIFAESGGDVSISLSVDNSTFSTPRTTTLVAGVNKIWEWRWSRFREGIFRITTTANDRIEFIDVSLDVEILDG